MNKPKLLIGTSKGLVVCTRGQDGWQIEQVSFEGMPVSLVYTDPRNGYWWVVLAHRHWGQKIQISKDEGKSWEARNVPVYPENAELKPGKPAVLRKVWSISHAGFDRPEGIWIGTEPGGLFYSADYGNSFQLTEGLWNHPSRVNENQWFGAGRDLPFLHSILVDPNDSDHVYIAVSCAGVFETRDGGTHWAPKNSGLVAAYLPNPDVEVGHDPHMMWACPAKPEVIWQQNHCGIFRSTDGGENWEDVSDKGGLANYGFALAIHETDPDQAWVIPALSDEQRIAVDLALCVCHTKDGGKTWTAKREGLPQKHCFDIVFRHAFSKSGSLMAFGTTTGNLYLSENEGNSWNNLSHHLARIDSVVFTKPTHVNLN